MPNRKKDAEKSSERGGQTADERREALINAIREEMDELTPEQLERLYAAIALMEMEKDD